MNPILYERMAMLALLIHVSACSVDTPKPVGTQEKTTTEPNVEVVVPDNTQSNSPSRDESTNKKRTGTSDSAMKGSLVVQRDPITGRLGAPAATVSIPTNPSNYSIAGLTPVAQLTGGAVVNLQGRFRGNAVAVIGPDGKVHLDLNYADGAAPEHGKQGSNAQ